jgi:hypothetical protein
MGFKYFIFYGECGPLALAKRSGILPYAARAIF